jgi:hypothetical protein
LAIRDNTPARRETFNHRSQLRLQKTALILAA